MLMRKILLSILVLLAVCSCTKPKYTDEPFFRLEYSRGANRFADEDYGREERWYFGRFYSSRASGPCFNFKPLNDTVRLAGFCLEVNSEDYFRFDISSTEAFFYDGKKYSFRHDPGSTVYGPVTLTHNNRGYYPISGDFCFTRLKESAIDRFLLKFNFDCFDPYGQDTIKIRDGFLTLCRRYTESNTSERLQRMMLYEK